MSEKSLHKSVCDYIRLQYPKVLFNSDMSGIRLTIGQATQAKRLRSNQGFPDIVIYEARCGWNALFIELKRDGERIYKKDGSPATPHIAEQAECLKMLRERGYEAQFAIGFDQAREIIDQYLEM
jgi:hypothetical protein